MRIYSSLWNADDWATRGGLVKTDWSKAPFTAYYRNFKATEFSTSSSNSFSDAAWQSNELDAYGRRRLRWAQKYFMIYNYCNDLKRFPQGIPAECRRWEILCYIIMCQSVLWFFNFMSSSELFFVSLSFSFIHHQNKSIKFVVPLSYQFYGEFSRRGVNDHFKNMFSGRIIKSCSCTVINLQTQQSRTLFCLNVSQFPTSWAISQSQDKFLS